MHGLFSRAITYEKSVKGRPSLAATRLAVLSAGRAVLVSGVILAAAMYVT